MLPDLSVDELDPIADLLGIDVDVNLRHPRLLTVGAGGGVVGDILHLQQVLEARVRGRSEAMERRRRLLSCCTSGHSTLVLEVLVKLTEIITNLVSNPLDLSLLIIGDPSGSGGHDSVVHDVLVAGVDLLEPLGLVGAQNVAAVLFRVVHLEETFELQLLGLQSFTDTFLELNRSCSSCSRETTTTTRVRHGHVSVKHTVTI